MEKIKVLRIIARLNIGGPAIHTILLTAGLDANKFKTILVCGRCERQEGDMFDWAAEREVRPLIIPQLGRRLNIYQDMVAFCRIYRLIRKERPDIIHTHTAKAGTLGRLAALLYNLVTAKKRCVLIHTFHGHVLHSYFGKAKSLVFIWIERLLALFTDRIVVVSERVRKELITLKIARPEKIVVIPLGLELERYLQIEKNSAALEKHNTVGIVGRLVPIKNHRMFLDAARRVKDALNSNSKTRFLIVGDGPLRRQLEDYAQRLNLQQDVIFTGWVKDLDEIYAQLDVVVLTSLNEGTPVALIEAHAASCPCVATKVGGVPDVVAEGKSGFLVPSGDTAGFTEALMKLLNNPELRQIAGRSGRNRVRDRFSKERLIKDIETLYTETLSK